MNTNINTNNYDFSEGSKEFWTDLGMEREETTLYDGREWRIHYWLLRRNKIAQLVDFYNTQSAGYVRIDGMDWEYKSGDLPGDFGGTTYVIGDTWEYHGRYFIKLGSGLEGSPVPELPAGVVPFLVMGAMFGVRVSGSGIRKRR